MAKKPEIKTEKIEREYIIPLRKKVKKVPRYKKTPKAIRSIKEFLVRHMKIYDRDLNKIKIDKYVNEYIWARGIKNPMHKIKVRAIKEGDIVRVELVDYPDKLKFKKIREDKTEKEGLKAAEKKKTEKKVSEETAEKKGEIKTEEEKKEESEKKTEEKEKKASVVEAGQELEKAAAKQVKHLKSQKIKQPKHQRRKALAK